MSELREVLADVLRGIDQDESEDEHGWWETSGGAEFGAQRLAATEAAVLAWFDARLTEGDVVEAAAEAIGDKWLDGGHGLDCEYREEPHDITATKSATAALEAVRGVVGRAVAEEAH